MTRDVSAWEIITHGIRGGHWREKVQGIRALFKSELGKHGDYKAAKRAVDQKKKALPGVMWSGTFRDRSQPASDKLITHSGLLCADLDSLGEALADIRAKLLRSPHLMALFLSPTGDGLKAVFRVPADAQKHLSSFRAVSWHVMELTGVEIDGACKDIARLCFVSCDPDAYLNLEVREIEPLPLPEKPVHGESNAAVNFSERQRIAEELLGEIRWESETYGFGTCPGKHLHTSLNAWRDCEIYLDGVPTVHCFHNSCTGTVAGVNHELRSRIAKAEYQAKSDCDAKAQPNAPTRPA